MAKVTVSGMTETTLSFERLAEMPESGIDDMLKAQADIFAEQIRANAISMLMGPYWEGAVSASVTIKAPQNIKGQRTVDITFEGTQHGNKLTEIAFVNEYGKSGQAARPFVRSAIETKKEAANEKAAAVLYSYEKSIGL